MRKSRPEDAIQRVIVAHYRARAAPGVFMFAVPNGGYRRPVEAAILRGTGVVAGVPDTDWIKDGQTYGLELKAPGGRLSESQRTTLAAMEAAGAKVCVAVGLDRALEALGGWGLLLGESCGRVPGGTGLRRPSPRLP
jgi:hypothetical protein